MNVGIMDYIFESRKFLPFSFVIDLFGCDRQLNFSLHTSTIRAINEE